GRQGYLWAILTRPERRLQLLHEGWRGPMTPFLLAIALDCIYQLMTIRFVYPLELLFTATLLGSPRTPCYVDRSIALPAFSCRRLGRPRSDQPTTTPSFTEETRQEGPTQCQTKPSRRTGRSPLRWPCPRAVTTKHPLSRGATAPSSRSRRPATAFPLWRRSSPAARRYFTATPKRSKRRSLRSPTRLRC